MRHVRYARYSFHIVVQFLDDVYSIRLAPLRSRDFCEDACARVRAVDFIWITIALLSGFLPTTVRMECSPNLYSQAPLTHPVGTALMSERPAREAISLNFF